MISTSYVHVQSNVITWSTADICSHCYCCSWHWWWLMTSDLLPRPRPLVVLRGHASVLLVDSETTWWPVRCWVQGVVQWRHGQLVEDTSVSRSIAPAAAADNSWMPCETCGVSWRPSSPVLRQLLDAALYDARQPMFLATVILQIYITSNNNCLGLMPSLRITVWQ